MTWMESGEGSDKLGKVWGQCLRKGSEEELDITGFGWDFN